jgi:predicted RNA binding protein YcfA (HicA-like mRNA interferase family)
MSKKLPSLTGAAVVQALAKEGFRLIRVRGSHHFLQHADGRKTVVPVHSGETIGSGLMGKILRDCGLDRNQFRRLLS